MAGVRAWCLLLLGLSCLACVVSGAEAGTEALSLEEIGDLSEVVPSEHKAYIAKLVQGELARSSLAAHSKYKKKTSPSRWFSAGLPSGFPSAVSCADAMAREHF